MQPPPGSTSFLDWFLSSVRTYGFATVVAAVLLGYMLWLNYSTTSMVVPLLQRVVSQQETISLTQAHTAERLVDMHDDIAALRYCVTPLKLAP